MTSVAKINSSQVSLCEAVIAASCEIREDFSMENVSRQLQRLVAEARQHISAETEQDIKLQHLLVLFYQHWGFVGAEVIYNLSEAIWLDSVLNRRQGTAVSLGIILLHIAIQLELPLMPVIFPTQLILRADWLAGW